MSEQDMATIHKVCAILNNGRVEIDFSTLSGFVHTTNLALGFTSIFYQIVHIHQFSPPEGYMIRFIEDGALYMGVHQGKAYFFPTTDTHTMRLTWFPTREHAEAHIKAKLCNKKTGVIPEDFDVLPFDHTLEKKMYCAARWEYVKEP